MMAVSFNDSEEMKSDAEMSDSYEEEDDFFQSTTLNEDGILNWNEFLKMIEFIAGDFDVNELKIKYRKADPTTSLKEFVEKIIREYVPRCDDTREDGGRNSPKQRADGKRMISFTELKEANKVFWYNDQDKDGRLSRKEFTNMLNTYGLKLTNRDISKIFKMTDGNGDGYVNFYEYIYTFISGLKPKKISPQQSIPETNGRKNSIVTPNKKKVTLDCDRSGSPELSTSPPPPPRTRTRKMSSVEVNEGSKYFWGNDRDGDGQLSIQEFTSMLSSFGLNLTNRDINKTFKKVDENGDGYVSFDEFSAAYLSKVTSKSKGNDTVKDIFDKNDLTAKGFLTKDECLSALKMLEVDISGKCIDKLLKLISKTNKIHLEDFRLCVSLL